MFGRAQRHRPTSARAYGVGVNFTGGDLKGTKFDRATLQQPDFTGAVVKRTEMSPGAQLEGVNIEDAIGLPPQ
ncbi:pentapeptide repeat-containing protein [Saccharopolyspora pogona]|uniref:pentapeptide repeat-containing protein n=1 Tax=Saccharopolyspora pogona TaxID=333966 RepID=UPI001683B05F